MAGQYRCDRLLIHPAGLVVGLIGHRQAGHRNCADIPLVAGFGSNRGFRHARQRRLTNVANAFDSD